MLAVNLAAEFAANGRKTLLVDLNLSMGNVDVLMNIYPKITLSDFISGSKSMEQCVVQTEQGFDALLAASGVSYHSKEKHKLREGLAGLIGKYDNVILDCPAGVSWDALVSISMARTTVVVVTPEPTAMTDCYALIKTLAGRSSPCSLGLLVNQVAQWNDGRRIYSQLRAVVDRFVVQRDGGCVDLWYAGEVRLDSEVRLSCQKRQVLRQCAQNSVALNDLASIARRLIQR